MVKTSYRLCSAQAEVLPQSCATLPSVRHPTPAALTETVLPTLTIENNDATTSSRANDRTCGKKTAAKRRAKASRKRIAKRKDVSL